MDQLAETAVDIRPHEHAPIACQQRVKSGPMFHRIAAHDPAAVVECLNTYGKLVWALSKRETSSIPEAEVMAQSVFTDIWRLSKNYDPKYFTEKTFVLLIILNRLKCPIQREI